MPGGANWIDPAAEAQLPRRTEVDEMSEAYRGKRPEPPESDVLAQGTKFDTGKTQLSLLAPSMIEGIGKVMTYGAVKYAPYNWAKGIVYSRVYDALLRHLNLWWSGEDLDDETQMHHLWHAGCCLMFLIHYESESGYRDFDDRPWGHR